MKEVDEDFHNNVQRFRDMKNNEKSAGNQEQKRIEELEKNSRVNIIVGDKLQFLDQADRRSGFFQSNVEKDNHSVTQSHMLERENTNNISFMDGNRN